MAFEMTVLAGAPLVPAGSDRTEPKPRIGCIILSPDGGVQAYAKIHLHPGEELFFSPGDTHMVVPAGHERVGVGICADTGHAVHPQQCADRGATVYAAGVLVSVGGYAADAALFAGYALKHGMLTLMANHNRLTGGWMPAGRSGIWSPDGRSATAAEHGDALVMAERQGEGWALSVQPVD